MKTITRFLPVFALLALTVAVPRNSFAIAIDDRIVLNGGGIYSDSDVTIANGTAAGQFIGGIPMFGGDGWGLLNIFFVDANSNLITDHLFSLAGSNHNCSAGSGADCVFFSSDPSADASIGTACSLGVNFCVVADGTLQDVTGMVGAQNGQGIFNGGSVQVQIAADAPEPASFLLFGTGMAALATLRSKRRSKI